jgi:hypothetical protein
MIISISFSFSFHDSVLRGGARPIVYLHICIPIVSTKNLFS